VSAADKKTYVPYMNWTNPYFDFLCEYLSRQAMSTLSDWIHLTFNDDVVSVYIFV